MTLRVPHAQQSPTWLRIWIALLPALPILSPVALIGLSELRKLEPSIQFILGVYAVTQLTAALLTPQPLLALGMAALRTLFMFGLIGLGVRLRNSVNLYALAAGLTVVYMTALLSAVNLLGNDLLSMRLSHPYYTSISLGIAGAFGVWIALDARMWRWPLRLAVGGLGLVILLLSGSRGPLLLALVGVLLLVQVRAQRKLVLSVIAVLLIIGSVFFGFVGTTLSRIASVDTTGRDVVWNDVLSVVSRYPAGGVGAYQLGPLIAPTDSRCVLYDALAVRGVECPPIVAAVNNFWVIAHNGFLQQAGETGLIGTLGLYLLLGAIAWSSWIAREPLALAVLISLLVGNFTDNVVLVPSPFFAEVFWLVAGMSLSAFRPVSLHSVLLIAAALVGLSAFPIWAGLRSVSANPELILTSLEAARRWRVEEPYNVRIGLMLPRGTYRIQLRACDKTCRTVAVTSPFRTPGGKVKKTLSGILPDPASPGLTLQVRLLEGQSAPWRIRPLAQVTWQVLPVRP